MGEWLCLKLDFSVLVWSLLKELGQLSALRRVRSEKGKYRRSPVLSDVVNYQIGFRLLCLFCLCHLLSLPYIKSLQGQICNNLQIFFPGTADIQSSPLSFCLSGYKCGKIILCFRMITST